MKYIIIMKCKEKDLDSLVYQQDPSLQSQIINQNQESKHNLMNGQPQLYQLNDEVASEGKTQPLSPTIIKVQPKHKIQPDAPLEETKAQQNFLFNSQTSESNEVDDEKVRKLQSPPEPIKDDIVFEQEESEDVEMSPQSSLRKLLKPPKTFKQRQEHEQQAPQKLLNEEISQSRIFQEEDSSDMQEQYEQIKTKKQLKSSNLNDLILFPIPKTKMIRCLIIITNNRFFALQNVFDLYLVQEKKHLLRATKKRFRISSSFQIFGRKQHIASIKSNFTRTQYKLIKYERVFQMSENLSISGFSSDIIKVEPVDATEKMILLEEEVCYLGYQSNFFGLSQQRVNIIKPLKKILNADRFSNLKATYDNCQYQRLIKYSTRMAEKGKDGKLSLDFKEKNIIDSSRNVILESQFGEAGIMFAKFSDEIYILNVMNPFNLLQAFFLGLCNLDRKLFVS